MSACRCGPDQTGEDIDVNPDCPDHGYAEGFHDGWWTGVVDGERATELTVTTVVHAHHPPACGSDLSDGTLWTGDTSRVTCTDCRIALAVAAERERIRRVIEEEYGPYAGRPMIRKLLEAP